MNNFHERKDLAKFFCVTSLLTFTSQPTIINLQERNKLPHSYPEADDSGVLEMVFLPRVSYLYKEE